MERPIIFSAPMVRAILEDRKSQTRRAVKPPRGYEMPCEPLDADDIAEIAAACPYGQPGDRLWVRETWSDANSDDGPCVLYRADNDRRYLVRESYPVDYAKYPGADFGQWAADVESGAEGRWRPSIYMPRWASRITLEITDVRVQRVQDISEEDARAEGVLWVPGHGEIERADLEEGYSNYLNCREGFRVLWDSINAKKYPWSANPWVWALTFKRVDE